MRLYLLPQNYNGEKTLTLTGKDYNYLVNVLRLKKNNKISARDRLGNIYELEILSTDNKICTLSSTPTTVLKENTDALPQDRPNCTIVLYQCLPKGRKTDEIIKRATEIGVYRVVLVKSKNCVSDISGKEDARLTRYDSLITEAVQQSGSTVPTAVEGVIDIKEVPDHFKNLCEKLSLPGCGIILHQAKLKEDQASLFKTLVNFKGIVGIAVGSEGGFTDEECSYLLTAGFKAVLLKTNILRCETASIYAISAAQTIMEESC